jgi:uncharacterized membrane protein YhhN
MNAAAIALLVAAAVTAGVDWFAVGAERRALEYACKPAAVALLIAAAITLEPSSASARGWFVVALVFCLMGDVLLMLPGDRFAAGLASFLVGHVCYIVGLTRGALSAPATAVVATAVALVGIVLARPILGAVRQSQRPLVVPVAAYMVVISTMVIAAGASAKWLAVAGAALFYVSDASIAWDKFVRSWPWARVWIMVTYHLGQAGLVLSLAR